MVCLENVRLQEAMSNANEQVGVIWSVEGLQVEVEGLPIDAGSTLMTSVMKTPNRPYRLSVLELPELEKEDFVIIDEISTMEEMKNKYPRLFEVSGVMTSLP